MPSCPSCGEPTCEHDRHARFLLPDAVRRLPKQLKTRGVWSSHRTPFESVLIRVRNGGHFVRGLLPVSLTGGYTATYGIWVEVSPEDFKRVHRVWFKPAYADLTIEGSLANELQPWGISGTQVGLVVKNPDEIPYCATSADPRLARVLTEVWPAEDVLPTLPKED